MQNFPLNQLSHLRGRIAGLKIETQDLLLRISETLPLPVNGQIDVEAQNDIVAVFQKLLLLAPQFIIETSKQMLSRHLIRSYADVDSRYTHICDQDEDTAPFAQHPSVKLAVFTLAIEILENRQRHTAT